MKKRIFGWLAILVGFTLAIGLFLPTDFAVKRSRVIKAPPAVISAYLTSPKRWNEWSAWSTDRDPTLKYTYSGPDKGVGARQEWTSENSGNGWLKITSSSPKTGIVYVVGLEQQTEPSRGTILLQRPPSGQEGTLVAWTMLGTTEGHYLMRYFALKFDDWIGSEFDTGLSKLKRLAEADAVILAVEQAAKAARVKTSMEATSSTSTTAITTMRTSTSPS